MDTAQPLAQRIGLNPYGLVYTLGLLGRGTPRANPAPLSLEGYVDLALAIGARGVEMDGSMLLAQGERELGEIAARIREHRLWAVLATGLARPGHLDVLGRAPMVGARLVRLTLTTVLAGDRAALGSRWSEVVDEARGRLRVAAARARELGVGLALENHQDFTSGELLAFCADAGDHVGICMDTGNPLAVGESCQDFLASALPRLRHVHLKDYRVQMTGEGFRLVRCALGDGAIPIEALLASLTPQGASIALECGAHEVRHIRVRAPNFWDMYPAGRMPGDDCLRSCLPARLPPDADYRTPWERGEGGAAVAELERLELEQSVMYLRERGHWSGAQ